MTTTTETGEIQSYRLNARLTHQCVQANAAGVTHAQSLVQPRPDGNCLNWAVGHLCCIYNNAMPLFGQEPVVGREVLARYDRGSAPLRRDPRPIRARVVIDPTGRRDGGRIRSGPVRPLDSRSYPGLRSVHGG